MNDRPPLVLITGAGRGIGSAFAKKFMDDGADVALNFRRSEGKAAANIERLLARAERLGVRAYRAKADISEPREVARMVNTLQEEGVSRIDHLMLNAASAPFKPFSQMTNRDWKILFGTNLIGNMTCVNHVKPLMPPGSTICAISSLGSRRALFSYPLGIVKSALENLVRYLEAELYSADIRVNGICAGLVNTDMLPFLNKLWPDLFARYEAQDRRWLIEPEEIANIAAFLASPLSSAIRGEIVMADGGMLASAWI
ncbi:SDR family oxidoreductase [Desulfatitalea alkaliphila]|uniref:SDR family oxidoreductase n=1 Tax=Desulfatitalea alkaliphila TaxID=2929485 RepID=A0AA41R483_9BACT|nr:SDR family oxidoreductase [Desulfatitalea alkaliphila]MCJ8503027.1 SDR family oxidoreductase [Desulfatitalea alkaliphila]